MGLWRVILCCARLEQGHHGQCEAERSTVSATTEQDVSWPGAYGWMDGPSGPSAQWSAPGKPHCSPKAQLHSITSVWFIPDVAMLCQWACMFFLGSGNSSHQPHHYSGSEESWRLQDLHLTGYSQAEQGGCHTMSSSHSAQRSNVCWCDFLSFFV